MVEILMATYNGEQFIEPQINSIISQTYKNWNLIIHDDGSTDNTLKILKNISSKDNRIRIINDGVKIGNAGGNFMHLIKYATADYIMFSDQDDIWDNHKIENMRAALKKASPNLPTVIYSMADVWDGEKILYTLTNKASTLNNSLFMNCGIQGASAMFNNAMLKLMKLWYGEISMHDHLLLLLGLCCGTTLHCNKPLMKYRRHPGAVTIKSRSRNNIKNIIAGRNEYVIDEKHFRTIKKFVQVYHAFLPENEINILNDFLLLPSKNFLQKCQIIRKHHFTIRNSVLTLLLKIAVRPFRSFNTANL